MADLSTLARPYAKAAFDYANEHDSIVDWEQFLLVASHIVKDGAFMQLLHDPAVSAEQKATALVDLYDTQVADVETNSPLKALLKDFTDSDKTSNSVSNNKVSSELKNFVLQLADNERLSLMPQIYSHYRQHKSEALKQVDAYVTTAFPLTEMQRTLIQAKLTASLDATVVLHESVDADLLAGATIKVGDKIVDDSVRGKLKQLKTQLTT